MNTTSSCFRARFVCCLLLCITLFGVAGCDKFMGTSPSSGGGGAPQALTQLDEAKQALSKGDYAKAEAKAQIHSQSAKSSQEIATASHILAIAATKNNHPNVALSALERWRTVVTGVDGEKKWQDAWCLATEKLSAREARNRANELYRNTAYSLNARNVAAIVLAVRQWKENEVGESLSTLEGLYSASTAQGKVVLENRLATQLDTNSGASTAVGAITPEQINHYPYNIIRIDQLRRESQTPANRAAALAALDALGKQTKLANPALIKAAPSASDPIENMFPAAVSTTPIASGPIAGHPIVLALPLTGQFANIATKIAAGAELACQELSKAGSTFTLVVVDTNQPDWVSRINGLPADASIVGGPLRSSDYSTAKAQGLVSKRAFFTFLPTLEGDDEGRSAWRFFASQTDQVNALLAFTSTLGIKGYAAFYPDDSYGQRMASIFKDRAGSMGATVLSASYPPRDPAAWLRAVGNLLTSNKNSAHASAATFQSIFLPDSWRSMDTIVPNIFSYNETRQVLLGSSLWEQGLGNQPLATPQQYALAIFPGSWNAAKPTAEGERLRSLMQGAGKGQADFWAGLGYDFARFAASVQIASGWSASSVNAALQGTSMTFSTAPIRWNSSGKAEAQLYLFTPAAGGGMAPLDEAAFRRDFSAAWK